ncbi:MAG: cell division protein FtsA [Bacteroidales bacterium]|jgi:cell division protein FtsA|nr:cell division protein FtsA [Bacteroidales bacterium]
MSEFIVGLDIGTTAIKVFIGKKKESGKIEIIGNGATESIGVDMGLVVNPGQAAQSIRVAVKQAEQMAGVEVKQVYVGVAGHHIQSRAVQGTATRQDPDDLITIEEVFNLHDAQKHTHIEDGMEIIDIMDQSYAVDREKCLDPVGRIGHQLEGTFSIIIGRKDCIKKIIKSVSEAGYALKGLILQSLASAESVLCEDDKRVGVCLVDIGGGTTDIAIFKQGFMRHIHSVPFAGNQITYAIEIMYNIPKRSAENIKIKYGTCLPEAIKNPDSFIAVPRFKGGNPKEINHRTLANTIKAQVELILGLIKEELNKNNYIGQLQAIILTGGGSLIRHIKQLSEYHIPDLVTDIDSIDEEYFENLPAELKQPIYATGLGLVIAAFKQEEEEQRIKPPIEPIVEDSKPDEEPALTEEEIIRLQKEEEQKKSFGEKVRGWFKSFNPFGEDDSSQDMY